MTAILSASRRHCLVSKRYDTRSLWLLVNCDSLRTSSWISAWKEKRERGGRKGMGLSANVKDPVRVRCVRCAQITAADRFGCSVRPGCRGKVVASCLFSPGLVLTPLDVSSAPPPLVLAQYCDESVSRFVCMSANISPQLHLQSSPMFVHVFRPWLGPPVAALRYVMHFRFYEWRHVCT